VIIKTLFFKISVLLKTKSILPSGKNQQDFQILQKGKIKKTEYT